jgi:hypothetical protein
MKYTNEIIIKHTHAQTLSTVENENEKKKENKERRKRTEYSTVFSIMLLIKFIASWIISNHFLHMWI